MSRHLYLIIGLVFTAAGLSLLLEEQLRMRRLRRARRAASVKEILGLVEELRAKGIRDERVLRAVEATPRHLFMPTGVRHRAYEDAAVLIGSGQTISQPFVHARSLELLGLTGTERALEIGTGSGYQTALLAQLAAAVFSVERIPALYDKALDRKSTRLNSSHT